MLNVEELLNELTLEEKCSLLSGESFWKSKGIEKYGIKAVMFTDGPHGLRKQNDIVDHLGLNPSIKATCFPTSAALASSWDKELIYRTAKAISYECINANVEVLLAPGANIKRSPLCGRNFEYFSEDPYLSSVLAKHYILGVQSNGVGCSIKHFVANNQETKRLTLNVLVDERTLREIYLSSFEIAIKEAKPFTVMCSYNKVNYEYGSENKFLLDDILRKEWGYGGLVVTDWGGINDRVLALKNGLDLEMPSSGGVNNRKVYNSIINGELDMKYLNNAVRRILTLQNLTANPEKTNFVLEDNISVAKEVAEDCIVLLKNDSVLPLSKDESVLVIGEFAEKPRFQGGGSSHTNPSFISDPLTELKKYSSNISYIKAFSPNDQSLNADEMNKITDLAKKVTKIVIFAGLSERDETEGIDRKHLEISDIQNKIIFEICKLHKSVVVVLSNGSAVNMPWKNEVEGIVEAYLLGSATGSAIASILFGEKSPSGKLAESFVEKIEDSSSFLNFPGENYEVEYKEGVFVGYRYYDIKKIEPLFEFGFGLSYTEFEYSNIRLSSNKITDLEEVIVTIDIKNVGSYDAKEIVQLYVSDQQSTILRPIQELKGFEKVFIKKNEKITVEFILNKRSFSYYDVSQRDWLVQSGKFRILVGSSSRDIRLTDELIVFSTHIQSKIFKSDSTFGELYNYVKTRELALEYIEYFKKESGIDFNLGDNDESFAFNVISDFPLKALVTFTKGRFSENDLIDLIKRFNNF